MTHPFHPQSGRQFEFVTRRRNWGEDRVCYHDERGELCSLPTGWTDIADADPFVVMAATLENTAATTSQPLVPGATILRRSGEHYLDRQ